MSADDVFCVILGGGGHARVLIDTLRNANAKGRYVVLDSNPKSHGQELMGIRIEGGDEMLPGLLRRGVNSFIVGVGGTGDNRLRKRLFDFAVTQGLAPVRVIDPRSHCSSHATIGQGAQILVGAVVNAGAVIGANVIVNSGAIVEHDCSVGDHVHVATGARLASSIAVGTGSHVGAGATVRQCLRIGEWAIVGAGAVVVKDVPAGETVVGVPAHPLLKAKDA